MKRGGSSPSSGRFVPSGAGFRPTRSGLAASPDPPALFSGSSGPPTPQERFRRSGGELAAFPQPPPRGPLGGLLPTESPSKTSGCAGGLDVFIG